MTSNRTWNVMGLLAGTAGGFAVSNVLNASPKAWADLVERVGVPFACMLLLALLAAALLKVIATPLVKSHVDFVTSLADTTKANVQAIQGLKELADSGMEVVREMQDSTMRNQEAILACLERVAPVDKSVEKHAPSV
jgi:hypothetical protein